MKVIVTNKPQQAPKTHSIVSPVIEEETKDVKKLLLDNPRLDRFAEDAELEELIIEDVLEFIPIKDVMTIIKSWILKIRHGGKICFVGTDAYLVCKAFVEHKLSIEEFNLLIHGKENKIEKTVSLTCLGLSNFLEDMGFKIERRRIDGYRYLVEAVRP